MHGKDATWLGFLAACFVVVGLAGVFATYAVPLPYERALAHIQGGAAAAGDGAPPRPEAVQQDGAGHPHPQVGPQIDMDAQAVLRDAAEEARGIALRVRLLLSILTIMAILFGAVVLRASQRRPAFGADDPS